MSVIHAADIELEADGLDPAVAARLLARRAAGLQRRDEIEAPGLDVVVWNLASERFALPLADVALLLPASKATPVPGSPPALLGLVTRRGRLLNIVDPALPLGVSRQDAAAGHLLVLRGTAPYLALRVDRVESVDRVTLDQDHGSPEMTRQAVLADGDRVLLVDRKRLVGAMGLTGQNEGM